MGDGSDAKAFVIPSESRGMAWRNLSDNAPSSQAAKTTPVRLGPTDLTVSHVVSKLVAARPIERSLAFARDDSSASVTTWSYRFVSLSFVSSALHVLEFRSPRSIASPENLSPRDQKSWHGTE